MCMQGKEEKLVAADLLALELSKKQAARATQQGEAAALAGQKEALQHSMAERRLQIQVNHLPCVAVRPIACVNCERQRCPCALHCCTQVVRYRTVLALRVSYLRCCRHIWERYKRSMSWRATMSAQWAEPSRVHPVEIVACLSQAYLGSLQAEQKVVRQALTDATMAAQKAQLRRERLQEKRGVIASTVVPEAGPEKVLALLKSCSMHTKKLCITSDGFTKLIGTGGHWCYLCSTCGRSPTSTGNATFQRHCGGT